ncbi:hypothetical protein [Haloglomus litoreum]|uniref:hypothetical protein n=1 Tax=Haloglomus litoreum TaxID=3034026 RepID=UPI0023E79142|nr:hypothetical protein [Haloglomus sp. DT116]
MYVSNAVQPMVEDPPNDPVALVLRTDDDTDPDDIVAAVEALGGDHERDLGFGDVLVTVPGDAVADVLDIDGLSAVETGALAEMTDADGAGEDVELGEGDDTV